MIPMYMKRNDILKTNVNQQKQLSQFGNKQLNINISPTWFNIEIKRSLKNKTFLYSAKLIGK